jgi:hypothetical protein
LSGEPKGRSSDWWAEGVEAMRRIGADAKGVPGTTGFVDCPRCGGRLTLAYRFQGRRSVRAKCQGEGCTLAVLA